MSDSEKLKCPSCDSDYVSTLRIDHEFQYGVEGHAVTLRATIPVRRCDQCAFEYTDHEAESLMEEAVQQHLSNAKTKIKVRTKQCPRCGLTDELEVYEADYRRWQNGVAIQRAMPYLSRDDAERLITGYCKLCWDLETL